MFFFLLVRSRTHTKHTVLSRDVYVNTILDGHFITRGYFTCGMVRDAHRLCTQDTKKPYRQLPGPQNPNPQLFVYPLTLTHDISCQPVCWFHNSWYGIANSCVYWTFPLPSFGTSFSYLPILRFQIQKRGATFSKLKYPTCMKIMRTWPVNIAV